MKSEVRAAGDRFEHGSEEAAVPLWLLRREGSQDGLVLQAQSRTPSHISGKERVVALGLQRTEHCRLGRRNEKGRRRLRITDSCRSVKSVEQQHSAKGKCKYVEPAVVVIDGIVGNTQWPSVHASAPTPVTTPAAATTTCAISISAKSGFQQSSQLIFRQPTTTTAASKLCTPSDGQLSESTSSASSESSEQQQSSPALSAPAET